MALPALSILIPVFNEESILDSAVRELHAAVKPLTPEFEIWLCENGSTDRTVAIATALAAEFPEVHWFSYHEPNYGAALREGMKRARFEYVFCFEIDFWRIEFVTRSFELFQTQDMIIASKQLASSHDDRGPFRKFASNFYNILLRWFLGFKGTETHGIKAYRRSVLAPVIERCVTDRDVFASEFVLRAERAGVRKVEEPVDIKEIRPQRVNLWKRVPKVLKALWRLYWSM